MRTSWIPNPDVGRILGNGIKSLTPLSNFIKMPENINIDIMHTTYGGTIVNALHGMMKNSVR
jgi:hypothetical protein